MRVTLPNTMKVTTQSKFHVLVLLAIFVFGTLNAGPARAIDPKIVVTPSSITLSEGASAQFAVTLVEPIVCPSPSSCSVTLNFADSVPPGIALSSPSIAWSYTEWNQTRTVSVSISDPSLLTNNQVVHLAAVASSQSEYYSGFSVNVAVTIAVTQTTTTNPSQNFGGLPETGSDRTIVRIALWTLLIGVAVKIRRTLRYS